jgi:hypothetical protein
VQRFQVIAARAAESVDDLLAEIRAESAPAAAAVQDTISSAASDLADKKVLS